MTTALILGGASCLHDDIAAYRGPIDGVVACNDAGAVYPEQLDAWVSLHCRYFETKGWRQSRRDAGYPDALRHIGHLEAAAGYRAEIGGIGDDVELIDYRFTPDGLSGSSGMFAAKIALIDMGFDRIVLAGIPMDTRPHFFSEGDWPAGEAFRNRWLALPMDYKRRISSMSGWTRQVFGEPNDTVKDRQPR